MWRAQPKASRKHPAGARFSGSTASAAGIGEITQYFEPVVLLGRA
jgi:hypothetical protein